MPNNTVYVIGSGPAGVSAAQALISQGRTVVMLDGGYILEQRHAQTVARMAGQEPDQWTDADVALIKQGFEVSSKGAKEKKVYGSSYANKQSKHFPITKDNSQYYLSFAEGGLSNLWGRGILPLCKDDEKDWPVSLSDLAPHYLNVLGYTPLAGHRDDLETLYTLHTESPQEYRLSSQSSRLLSHMRDHRVALKKQGILTGATRLAADMDQCRYCGMCMYGCPYGLLYSSGRTVKELKESDLFTYRPGVVVTRLEEVDNHVIVHAVEDGTGAPLTFSGDKAFVGAGSIASTRIMLDSIGQYDSPASIKCSDMYYMPAFALKRGKGVVKEDLFTLSQVMMEIHNPELSDRIISTHLHGYNDLFLNMLTNAAGFAGKLAAPFINTVLERLFVLFAFFHSDDSATIELTLKRDGSLYSVGKENPESLILRDKLRKLLHQNIRNTGIALVPFYSNVRPPGASMHFGGSLPMSGSPSGLQTDTLGRVQGMERVYVVDGAVFPTIPAGSYTFTIMANAHRIGWEGA